MLENRWFWDKREDENTYTILDADGFIVAALIPSLDIVNFIVRTHNEKHSGSDKS